MIDENKLIEEFLSSDGIEFKMNSKTGSEEEIIESLQEFADKIREGVLNLIKSQPKVGEWIPVSVGNPQRQSSDNTILKYYQVSTKRGNVRFGFRNEDGKWLTEHGNVIPNVIAWMPLQEPYKE